MLATHLRFSLFFILALGFVGTLSKAETSQKTLPTKPRIYFKSTQNQIHLLELFSSEGCSSCPPADKWMSSLKNEGELFKTFVPVAFHVDYWNHLGWIDPYSNKVFTSRQKSYSTLWKSDSIFTPNFVLDGKNWKSRSKKDLRKLGARVGILSLKQIKKNRFKITFEKLKKGKGKIFVNLALLKSGIVSKVTAGELKGETLNQDFIVLEYKSKVLKKLGENTGGKDTYTTTLSLSASKLKNSSLSLAAWVNLEEDITPLQAIGGNL